LSAHGGKKNLTNGHFCGLIPLTSKTIEAGVTLQAHPQRVPGAGKGTKSGAANGPLRAGGKGKPEYPLTRCLRYGATGVLASGKVAVLRQSRWYRGSWIRPWQFFAKDFLFSGGKNYEAEQCGF
jgi:hypothetical protein